MGAVERNAPPPTMTKITGTGLLDSWEQMLAEGKTKSEIVRACGYTSIKSDGTERLHFTEFYTEFLNAIYFTDFYTEMLNAKGIEMETEEEVEETLSASTINNLADAVVHEVAEHIMSDERYADFMMEVIPDAIVEKLGNIDEDLKMELSMCIMDRLYFKVSV